MAGLNIISARGVGHVRGTWRGTEEKCIKHIDNIENTENTTSKTICELHVLPEGMVCAARVKEKDIYLCPHGKEGCPLKG